MRRHGVRVASLVGLLWVCGCDDPLIEEVTPGIYTLEVTRTFDDCTPPRAAGIFESAIEIHIDVDGFIVSRFLYVPTGTSMPTMERVEISPDLEANLELELLECEGGVVERRLNVTSTSPEQLVASLVDQYAGLARCPAGSEAVPVTDCRSESILRYYRLRVPCMDPCTIEPAETPAGTFLCTCP